MSVEVRFSILTSERFTDDPSMLEAKSFKTVSDLNLTVARRRALEGRAMNAIESCINSDIDRYGNLEIAGLFLVREFKEASTGEWRNCLLETLDALTKGRKSASIFGENVCVYAEDMTETCEAANQFVLDLVHESMLDSPFMEDIGKTLSHRFNAIQFAAMAADANPASIAEALTLEQQRSLMNKIDQAGVISSKSLLGKNDGRSGLQALVNLINKKIESFVDLKIDDTEKIKLVKLIHDAQGKGATLLFNDVAVTVTASQRPNSRAAVRLRETGGKRRTLHSTVKIPENLRLRVPQNS